MAEPPESTRGILRNALRAARVLRAAGAEMTAQAALHGQLAQVEWAEEKRRLGRMLLTTLLGFALLQCLMLLIAVLVLALSWQTPYRFPALLALVLVCGLGSAVTWRRLQALVASGDQSFAATRAELAADFALLKSRL